MSKHVSLFRQVFILAALLCVRAPVQANELQDPTRPSYISVGDSPDQAQAAPSLVLNAIRLSPGQRSAMINNRTVKVGEQVGAARVVAIDRGGVRLQRGTEQLTLQLLPIKVKQAHTGARR